MLSTDAKSPEVPRALTPLSPLLTHPHPNGSQSMALSAENGGQVFSIGDIALQEQILKLRQMSSGRDWEAVWNLNSQCLQFLAPSWLHCRTEKAHSLCTDCSNGPLGTSPCSSDKGPWKAYKHGDKLFKEAQ